MKISESLGQTSNVTCPEPSANEQKLLFSLINIRFGWKKRKQNTQNSKLNKIARFSLPLLFNIKNFV